MKAHEKLSFFTQGPDGSPVAPHVVGDSTDVGGIGVIVLNAHGLAAPRVLFAHGFHSVINRGRRLRCKLREQGKNNQTLGPDFIQKLRKLIDHPVCAVAHRPAHFPALTQRFFQGLCCLSGDRHQRRPLFRPHGFVARGRGFRAFSQNNAVQDGKPQKPRHFHDAGISQKFRKIGFKRLFGGRSGRARVNQEHQRLIGICFRHVLTLAARRAGKRKAVHALLYLSVRRTKTANRPVYAGCRLLSAAILPLFP